MGDEKIHSYRDLMVWKKSMELAKEVYEVTRDFPEQECFGLTAQIRRAAVSVPSTIAEGQARQTSKDFIHFLYVAKGSLAELDTQLSFSHELSFLDKEVCEHLLQEIDTLQRMLLATIAKLKGSQ
jgi:four helix bundle protein